MQLPDHESYMRTWTEDRMSPVRQPGQGSPQRGAGVCPRSPLSGTVSSRARVPGSRSGMPWPGSPGRAPTAAARKCGAGLLSDLPGWCFLGQNNVSHSSGGKQTLRMLEQQCSQLSYKRLQMASQATPPPGGHHILEEIVFNPGNKTMSYP